MSARDHDHNDAYVESTRAMLAATLKTQCEPYALSGNVVAALVDLLAELSERRGERAKLAAASPSDFRSWFVSDLIGAVLDAHPSVARAWYALGPSDRERTARNVASELQMREATRAVTRPDAAAAPTGYAAQPAGSPLPWRYDSTMREVIDARDGAVARDVPSGCAAWIVALANASPGPAVVTASLSTKRIVGPTYDPPAVAPSTLGDLLYARGMLFFASLAHATPPRDEAALAVATAQVAALDRAIAARVAALDPGGAK